jgi:hypothetical protein
MGGKGGLVLILILMSSLFMVLAPVHSVAAEPARVYVDPPTVVDPSTFFNVSVRVENVQELAGIQLTLKWDPSLLYGVNMTDVIFHQVTPQSEWDNIWRIQHKIDNVAGNASYAYTFVDYERAIAGGYFPIAGNFTIFDLLFQVRGVGNCALHFDLSILGQWIGGWSYPIVHDTIDGFVSNSILPPPIPPAPPGDAQVSLYVNPRGVKDESLTVNSTFSITIEFDNLVNVGIGAVGFVLDWNSSILQCVNVTEVMFHEVMPQSDWGFINTQFVLGNDSLSIFNYFGAGADGKSYNPIFGNHTVAIVAFRVISVGKCQLYLHDCRIFDSHASFVLYTARSGYFSNAMCGDLNVDGVVNLFDAVLLSKSFGARPENQIWNEDADINGDGFIDIFDALLLCNSFGHSA